MWVKNLVKLVLMLHFVALSSQSDESIRDEVDLSDLPSIWDDEVVSRMVRDVLVSDLAKEHEQKQLRRMHKRDVQSTATTIATTKASTTRKVAATTQKSKKPTRVSQAGSKNKNRVTTSSTIISTKATVKPDTKPIVTNSGSSGLNKVNVNSIVANNNVAANSSKSKVSRNNVALRNFLITCSSCFHVLRSHNSCQWLYDF